MQSTTSRTARGPGLDLSPLCTHLIRSRHDQPSVVVSVPTAPPAMSGAETTAGAGAENRELTGGAGVFRRVCHYLG